MRLSNTLVWHVIEFFLSRRVVFMIKNKGNKNRELTMTELSVLVSELCGDPRLDKR